MTFTMKTVEVNELQSRPTQIVRDTRESGSAYTATVDGQPVATLSPCERQKSKESEEERRARALAWLEQWHALGEEISKHWPAGVSAVDAVAEQRR